MAELVTKGLIGGHVPTGGFYETVAGVTPESILAVIEAQAGSTPLIRVRMDLNGDGVFEVVEQSDVMSVGNLTRSIEYFTNKPVFGSANMTIRNNDLRYSDNNPDALTYFDPANPYRYHMRKVLIDLGFDGPNKENAWQTIFTGYITQKDEDAESRQVDISLMDEWNQILNFDLAPTISGDEFFDYDPAMTDSRKLQLGTYYGAQRFIPAEYTSKENQLMIPCAANVKGAAKPNEAGIPVTRFQLIKMLAYNSLASGTFGKLYFWDWGAKSKQWLEINPSFYTVSTNNDFLTLLYNAIGTHKVVGDADVPQLLAEYFDTTNPDCDPLVAVSMEGLESNPIRQLFDVLYSIMEVPISDLDASSATPSAWGGFDVDFANPNYFSFDVSSHYLDSMAVKTCVRINQKTSVIDLISNICTLTRGSFFIDKGRAGVGHAAPIRRIRFVIHQPRLVSDTILTLPEARVQSPKLSRSIDKIINSVSVVNYNYSSLEKLDSVDVYLYGNSGSMDIYGERKQSIDNAPGSIIFLYESENYALFLAQHYVMIFGEPPMELSFDSDLIGTTWDLKSMFRIQEKSSLGLSKYAAGLKDVFEVYSIALNSTNFLMNFVTLWAGYLIMPSGNSGRRWAFCENSYCDAGPDSLEYHCW